ncbi:hypothetical protein DEF23_01700 [Marinitenerispora sediminis]|uniref:Galactose oxidase n=2 Tax=Marinitenerispora sediminis TaxID=1931232 RepID=A0A368TCG3_9ACTN|nr:hypothetical protein DEF28_02990 [Marinitenerispora sediminis]RCV61690.1 hypothetical protein DEF23_01700 [Marinitenerispora sediminis]RCV62666.1 hypothetical protein DEF24_00090 [Marinitenerispora sediminis]
MVRVTAATAAALATTAALAGPAQAEDGWRLAYGSPELGGTFDVVAAADAGNVWAFGIADDGGPTWIHRWDGADWQREELPADWTLRPTVADASAADNVWAAGVSEDGASTLHYDGTAWRAVELDPALVPTDIEALSEDEVWLLSEPVDGWARAAYFDGEVWRDYPAPESTASAVSGVASDAVFAAGYDGDQPSVERWDGTRWQPMDVPEVDLPGGEPSAGFTDVYARAADDVWAVGDIHYVDDDERNRYLPLLAHWDGTEWTVETGESEGRYSGVTDDGAGGLWIKDGSWDGDLVHRTADGELTRYTPTQDGYELHIPKPTAIPGTTSVLAAGQAYPEGDPDVPVGYGVVFAYGL